MVTRVRSVVSSNSLNSMMVTRSSLDLNSPLRPCCTRNCSVKWSQWEKCLLFTRCQYFRLHRNFSYNLFFQKMMEMQALLLKYIDCLLSSSQKIYTITLSKLETTESTGASINELAGMWFRQPYCVWLAFISDLISQFSLPLSFSPRELSLEYH